jgi:hypothetical protein
VISDPTFSSAYKTERYAFWEKQNQENRSAWQQNYNLEIDQNPCTFE